MTRVSHGLDFSDPRGILQNLVHEDAALVVFWLYVALDKLFLILRKPGEAHLFVMVYQAVIRQGVDVQCAYTDIFRNKICQRKYETFEKVSPAFFYVWMRSFIFLIHGKI